MCLNNKSWLKFTDREDARGSLPYPHFIRYTFVFQRHLNTIYKLDNLGHIMEL